MFSIVGLMDQTKDSDDKGYLNYCLNYLIKQSVYRICSLFINQLILPFKSLLLFNFNSIKFNKKIK